MVSAQERWEAEATYPDGMRIERSAEGRYLISYLDNPILIIPTFANMLANSHSVGNVWIPAGNFGSETLTAANEAYKYFVNIRPGMTNFSINHLTPHRFSSSMQSDPAHWLIRNAYPSAYNSPSPLAMLITPNEYLVNASPITMLTSPHQWLIRNAYPDPHNCPSPISMLSSPNRLLGRSEHSQK